MGNQLTVNTLRNNLQDFKPDLQNYNLVNETCISTKKVTEKYQFLREWKHKYEKKVIIEHQFQVNSQEQVEKALQIFVMRYHNDYVLSTQFIIMNESSSYQLRIFSQKSITNLKYFRQIPSYDGAYFILQILKAFSRLVKKFGPFLVSQQMFQITQNRQIKIWFNESAINQLSPNDVLLYSQQHEMIRKILDIVQQNLDFKTYQEAQKESNKIKYLNYNMIEVVKRSNVQTIEAAIKLVEEIFQQERIIVKNKQMMCLKAFQYQELLNINSLLKNKNNQYYQNNRHQNVININQRQQNIPITRVSNNSMTNIIPTFHTNLKQNLLQKQQPQRTNCIKRSQSLTSIRKGGISLTKTSKNIITTTQIPSHIHKNHNNFAVNTQTSFYTIENNSTSKNRLINHQKSYKQILRLGQKRSNSKSYVSIEKNNCKSKMMNGVVIGENVNININGNNNNDSRTSMLKKTSRVIINNNNNINNNISNTSILRIPKCNIQNIQSNYQKKQDQFSLNNQYYLNNMNNTPLNHMNSTQSNLSTPLSPKKINYSQPHYHQQSFIYPINNNSTISYNYSISPKKINNMNNMNKIDKYSNTLTYFDKQQLSRFKQQGYYQKQNEDIPKIYVYGVKKQQKINQNVRFVHNNIISMQEYNYNRQKYNNNNQNRKYQQQQQNSMLQQQNQQTQRISTQNHIKKPTSYKSFKKQQLFTDPNLYNYITCDLDKKQLQKKRSSIEYSSFILSKQNILSKNKILQQSYTTTQDYLQSVPVSESIDANLGQQLNRLNILKKNKNMEMLIEENSIKELKSIDMISYQELVQNNNTNRDNNYSNRDNNYSNRDNNISDSQNDRRITKNVSWKPFNIQHLQNGSQQKIPIKSAQYSQTNSYNQLYQPQPQNTIRRGYQQSVVMQYKKFNQNITDRSNNNNTDRRYFSPLKNVSNLQPQNKVDFKKSPVRYINMNTSPTINNVVGYNDRQMNQRVKYVVYNHNEKLKLQNQKPSINPILMQDLQKIRRNKIF